MLIEFTPTKKIHFSKRISGTKVSISKVAQRNLHKDWRYRFYKHQISPTMSVGNCFNSMIFWNGLLDGVANPLTNNELYLSSNPLMNKPLDSTVFIPVILVSPCSRLEILF